MPPIGQNLLAALGMHWLRSDLRPGPRGGHFYIFTCMVLGVLKLTVNPSWITG